MKLYRYDTLEDLNRALAIAEKNKVPVAKVKLLTESEHTIEAPRFKLKTVYYVLTDEKNDYQAKKEAE